MWHHFLFVARIINTHRLPLISSGYFISINGVYIERHTASVEWNVRHSTYKFLQQKLILCKTKAQQKSNSCAHWVGQSFSSARIIIVYHNRVSGSLATKFIFVHSFWIISFLYLIQFSLFVYVRACVVSLPLIHLLTGSRLRLVGISEFCVWAIVGISVNYCVSIFDGHTTI